MKIKRYKSIFREEDTTYYTGYAPNIYVNTRNVSRSDIQDIIEYLDSNMWAYSKSNNLILISPKNANRNDILELKSYLDNEMWDYSEKKK